MDSVSVNGRSYRLPRRPVAVVCLDGCAPAYFEDALARVGRYVAAGEARSVGLVGNAADVFPELARRGRVHVVVDWDGAPRLVAP